MNTTLTFMFTEEEGEDERMQIQLDAMTNYCALTDIQELFRKRRKYYELTKDLQAFFDEFDEEFRSVVAKTNLY